MIRGKQVLLTGEVGFIGTAIATRLIEDSRLVMFDNGHRDSMRDAPLRSPEALGRRQLAKPPEAVATYRRIAERYGELLAAVPVERATPAEPEAHIYRPMSSCSGRRSQSSSGMPLTGSKPPAWRRRSARIR
jgi:nucleoside-diphosphate-sugar epimerase